MPELIRLIPAADPEWDQWLERVPHDAFHTAAYHRVWQSAGEGEAWLAVFGSTERFLLWPYLLRPVGLSSGFGQELYDVSSVYGYSGPLVAGASPGDPFAAAAREAIFELWRRANVVSVFSRFHPLLNNHMWLGGTAGCPCLAGPDTPCPCLKGVRHHGHTVSIDLGLSEEQVRQEYRKNHWHQIDVARRQGMVTEVDEGPEAFEAFVRLYHDTMRRNRADRRYLFTPECMLSLRRALGARASIHVARFNQQIVAASLVTECGGLVQYLFAGSSDDYGKMSPLKLLIDDVRRWARKRGNHTMHLGGGRGGCDDDSLFLFKKGFSDRRHCFYTGRWILDWKVYDRLADERRREAGEAGISAVHFPAYRAPLTQHLDLVKV